MKFFRSPVFLILLAVTAFMAGLFTIGSHFGLVGAIAAYVVAESIAKQLTTSYNLGAVTNIANLWTPDIWIPGLRERVTQLPSLINSGIVVRDPQIDDAASGPGVKANVPFIKEPNFDNEIQQESVAPTVNNLTSGKQVATILNRVSAIGATALSKAVSGADPLGTALDIVAGLRLRQQQKTLLAVLRGVFGFAAAPGAGAAALKTLRNDIFIETGLSATAANLFSSNAFIDTTTLLGEIRGTLQDGILIVHSTVASAMLKLDSITYIRDSEGRFILQTYKGIPVFISDLLTRAGATNGKVFDTYFALPASVSSGSQPQSNEVGDVSSLLIDKTNIAMNNVAIYDRTRTIFHPQGCAWGGTPVGQSATDAELAVEASWSLAYGDVKNVKMVCLRTNG